MTTLYNEMTKEEIIKLFVQGGAQYGVFGPNPFGPGGPFGGSDPAGDPGGGSTMGMGFDNQEQASEYGRLLQDFLNIFRPYIADQDLDDIDRINRQNQASEFLDVLAEYVKGNATLRDIQGVDVSDLGGMDGWDDYYSDFFVLDPTADIRQTLRDNGYSEDAIEDILDAEVNNDRFKGNNVLSNALCQIGYSNCSDWSVTAVNPTGDECANDDGYGTYQNGKCVTDTSEGTPCWTYSSEAGGRVEGKRGPNEECIPSGSGGDDGTGDGASDTNCTVITQENADECGYEITSDGQLVPKDLSGDPDSYPTYVNCGGGIFAETEADCPEMEGTGGYSEEEQSTAEAIRDWIEGQIGRIEDMTTDDILDVIFGGDAWDPLCKDEGDLTNCTGTDGTQGNKCWKDCVSVSVLGGIPGLPLPPGAVDIGTIRDLENTVNEVGGSIADVFDAPTGDTDDEGWIQRTKDWVIGKIEDIFGDLDDVTLEDITGWITGILGPVAAGIILQEVEGATNTVRDKIDDILLGVAPDGDDDENCIEREYFEANQEKCTALGYLDCDASVGEQGQELTGGIIGPDQTTEGCQEIQDPQCIRDGRWDGEKCVCPEGSDLDGQEEPLSGDCSDDGGDDTTVEGDCPQGSEVANPQYDFYDLQNTGTYSFGGQTYEYDPCNPSQPHTVVTGGGDDGCTGGQKKFDGENCEDPCPTNSDIGISNPACGGDGGGGDVYDPDCATDPRPTGPLTFELQNQQDIWDRKCGGTTPPTICDNPDALNYNEEGECIFDTTTYCQDQNATNTGELGPCECPPGFEVTPDGKACLDIGGSGCTPRGDVIDSGCDGTTFFIRFSSGEIDPNTGECGEIYDTVPNYAGCGGGGYECDDPNATVNEDGSCGPCKAGYVFNGSVERCVQDSTPNPCDDPAYAEANPNECGQCNDCSCAEYAAANPEECGTGGGGGAGGGVGGGGMFSMTPVPITASPELLAAAQFPIVNFLSKQLPADVKSNVLQGLFTGDGNIV